MVLSLPSNHILFSPLAFLQYGPSPSQGVPLPLRSAEFSSNTNNLTTVFYTDSVSISFYRNETQNLYRNDTVQPSFDSYFSLNRFVPQIVPKVSNVSLTIAKVLNPFDQPTAITQAKLAPVISLPSTNESTGKMTSYVIPAVSNEGRYLVTLSAYFPEYKVHANYSNVVYIHKDTKIDAALATLFKRSDFPQPNRELNNTSNLNLNSTGLNSFLNYSGAYR
jgi:hypothetical protein